MKSFTEPTEKIKTYENLIHLLQKNPHLNYLGEYKKYLLILSNNQEALEKLETIFNNDFTHIFKEKENNKKVLVSNLKKVAGLLKLSAQASKNKKANNKIDFLTDSLEDISDKRLLKYTQKTLSIANKLGGYSITAIDNVSPKKLLKQNKKAKEIDQNFGLSVNMIKQLEEAGINFKKSIVITKTIVDERLKTMKQIKKLFDKNDKLINNKIEKLIEIFEKPGSVFYNDYLKLKTQSTTVEKAPVMDTSEVLQL